MADAEHRRSKMLQDAEPPRDDDNGDHTTQKMASTQGKLSMDKEHNVKIKREAEEKLDCSSTPDEVSIAKSNTTILTPSSTACTHAAAGSREAETAINQHSPLLELPPELRNRIYDYVTEDCGAAGYRDGVVVTKPALAVACRQLLKEVQSMYKSKLPLSAKKIRFQVRDFDFDRTLEVIMKLPEPAREALSRKGAIRIELTFVGTAYEQKYSSLLAWLLASGMDYKHGRYVLGDYCQLPSVDVWDDRFPWGREGVDPLKYEYASGELEAIMDDLLESLHRR